MSSQIQAFAVEDRTGEAAWQKLSQGARSRAGDLGNFSHAGVPGNGTRTGDPGTQSRAGELY